MHSKVIGGLGVAKVVEFFIEHEIPVFNEVFCDNSEFDLIVDTKDGLKTIQVRTRNSIKGAVALPLCSITPGTRKTACKITRGSNRIDFYALYVRNKDLIIFIEQDKIKDFKREISFRIDDPKNLNGGIMRFAKDYRLPSFMDGYVVPEHDNIKNENAIKEKNCPNCKSLFVPKNKSKKCCPDCGKKFLNRNRADTYPTKQELLEMLKLNTWVDIGHKFGVTDNAVRKWAKKYGLPTRRIDLTFSEMAV